MSEIKKNQAKTPLTKSQAATNSSAVNSKDTQLQQNTLLGTLLGAVSDPKATIQDIQARSQRLSSSLRKEAPIDQAESSDVDASLTPPELPEAKESVLTKFLPPEAKDFVQRVSERQAAVRELQTNAVMASGDPSVERPKTPSGAEFNLDDDVSTIFSKGHGKVFSDADTIRDIFKDRTPDQIAAIYATHDDRYEGRNLDADLKDDLSDEEYAQIQAYRRGDRGTAAAIRVDDLTSGAFQDSKKVADALKGLSSDELAVVQEKVPKLRQRLQAAGRANVLSPAEQAEAEALLAGEPEQAQSIIFQDNLKRKKGSALNETLRSLSPQDRVALIEREGGQAALLEASEKLKGPKKGEFQALISGDLERADAYRVDDAVDGWDVKVGQLERSLKAAAVDPDDPNAKVDPARVKRVVAIRDEIAAQRNGEPLEQRIREQVGNPENRRKLLTLTEEGQESPEQRLLNAMTGNKRDGQETSELVREMGVEQATKAYARMTRSDKSPEGRSLSEDINKKLGGRGRLEAQLALEGVPEDPDAARQQRVEQNRKRLDFEKQGRFAVLDVFTDADEYAERNQTRSEEALAASQEARNAGSETDKLDFRTDQLTGYTSGDIKNFQSEKDGATEGAAIAATVVVATVVTAPVGGAGGLALGVTLGAGTRVGVKSALSGGSYDHNDMAKDGAIGGAEGLTMGAGKAVGTIGRRMVASSATKAQAKVLTPKIAQEAAEQGKSLSERAIRNRAIQQASAKAAPKEKLVGATTEGILDGAVGGGGMAAVETGVADGNFDDGVVSGLKNIARNTALGTGLGAGLGGAIGRPMEKGMDALGSGVRKILPGQSKPRTSSVEAAELEARPPETNKSPVDSAKGTADLAAGEASTLGSKSLPSGSWRDQAYQSSDSYKNLSESQQRQVDDLVSNRVEHLSKTEHKDMQVRQIVTLDSLVGLMETGKLWTKDADGVTVAQHLKNLRDNPRHPKLANEAQEIFDSAVRIVNNPGVIHQGGRGACAVATTQYLHVRKDPADFLRVTDGLTSKGSVTLKSGEVLKVNESSLETYKVDSQSGSKSNFDPQTGQQNTGIDPFTGLGKEGPTDTVSVFKQLKAQHPDVEDETLLAVAKGQMLEANRGPVSRIYQSSAFGHVAAVDAKQYKHIEKVYDNLAHMDKDGNYVSEETLETLSPEKRKEVFEQGQGGFTMVSKNDGSTLDSKVGDGLLPEQTQGLRDSVLGVETKVASVSQDIRDSNISLKLDEGELPDLLSSDAQSRETYRELLEAVERAENGEPVSLGVNWRQDSPDSGHAIALVGRTKDGKILIRNSQVTGRDLYSEGELPRDSSPEAVGELRSRSGYSAVEPAHLLARLKSVVY